MPYERLVMMAFAYAGYVVVGFVCIFTWYVAKRAFGQVLPIPLTIVAACLTSLLWADGVAHLGKERLLGPCNPFYAACNGEHEGWTGVTTSAKPDERELFERVKCGPPPGGNAHPMLPWLGNPPAGCWCSVCK